MNEKMEQLRGKAMKLPLTPGVYIMKNKADKIIYIGKAKMLKNRVSQYFGSQRNHSEKVRRMVSNVDDFDYILCDSEFEALVLECSLIKQNMPKYNILLKDDKGYCYIRVSPPPYSRISEVKQIADDGAEYIGPYMSSWAVKQAVDEARKIFSLPDCNRVFPRDIGKGRPCLNYSIKQCCAPCRGNVSAKEYEEAVKGAVAFLKGGRADTVRILTEQMEQEAENLQFERAARLRDRIRALQKINEKQKVVASRVPEQDVIGMIQSGNEGCFAVMRFKDGSLFDKEVFFVSDPDNGAQARMEFLQQYYTIRENIPRQITMDELPEDKELIEEWLSQRKEKSVHIVVPQKGEQYKLVQMCVNNAAEQMARRISAMGHKMAALNELAKLLGMKEPPSYIEAYDISNFNGSENVAGMVVFEQGHPLKSAYRKFKIKTVEGQDDYGSMREVICRRFAEYEQLKDSGKGFGRMPDLLLLDGGKGHVAVVKAVLAELGYSVPVFGMVKDDKHRTRAIAQDGSEIVIRSNRTAFTLVSEIQEEVHRFAIGYHRKAHSKKTLGSSLQKIPGIGKKRADSLMRHFRTMSAVMNATAEELCMVEGMNRPTAEKLYYELHRNDGDQVR